MQFLNFIFSTVLHLYTAVLLLRIWMQWARCDFYNPFSQFVVKITQPVVRPLRRVIPSVGPIDMASVVLAFVLVFLKIMMPIWLNTGQFFPSEIEVLPNLKINSTFLFPYSLIQLLTEAGKLVFWLVIARALLSWISQGRNPVDYVLLQLTEPLMSPIRRIIPSMGGLDFSAMIVILILYALNYLSNDIISWLISMFLIN
ncbi:YggT family protein [Xenorhabdus szentirmaii]|uniref:YggT family protein n=2 Tax=Xenorhabdus szentirmaii TaxID=290112 RepID=W1IUW5_9GAMM|nr:MULTISPECIES: YggT family protein [Xenorhabdus]MBD2781063.1 YggT family protein [Xenorhabdus sp. 38]MBD2792393.1 YggT family protein [Xenorhabdus sp. CUL]MBD2802243.1 YggT family protein [Xenorhabdus sp. M]MBD2805869.1 YggT family protein [Xenorhabdus sp. ZM]MBD2822043.1 YggT family protein [Xenorhabdus sp. 42]